MTINASARSDSLSIPARNQTPESLWWRTLRRFRKHRLALLAMFFLSMLIFSALFPWLVTGFDPLEMDVPSKLQSPSFAHWFGTDDFGRDIFARVIYGSRVSLQVGLIAVGIAATSGTLIGLLAGYFGKLLDSLLMRVMDVIFAFPAILLAIAIVAILGTSTRNVMIAIGIIYIPIFARIVRGSTLELKTQDYIEAAHASGAQSSRILWRHILPGTMGPLTVGVSLALADAILAEAALSFLGLGTQPPDPTWGSMLSFGRDFIREAPWFSFFPGLAIFVTVLSLNLVGDGWRDALDARL